MLANNPYIDKQISFDKDLIECALELRKEKYDYVIDLHNNLRSTFIKLMLFQKSSAVRKMNWSKWRMVNAKSELAIPHIVERYLSTCKNLGLEYDGKGLDHFTSNEAQVWMKEVFDIAYSAPSYVVFAIGGQFQTKRLPLEKWILLADSIQLPIHVLGGTEDKAYGAELERIFPDKVINWTGKISVDQSAEIIKKSSNVYTNDTGMMHIAAAFDKNIDIFWGNTTPRFGMYPFYPENSTSHAQNHEVLNLTCRPCSKIGFKACPKGHFNCMNLQEIS